MEHFFLLQPCLSLSPRQPTVTSKIVGKIKRVSQLNFCTTTLKYAWGVKNDGTYKKFASVFATSTVVIESHFRPKKNITVIMQKPIDMDDSDNDAEEGVEVDNRPVKTKLQGFIIPSFTTRQGEITLSY